MKNDPIVRAKLCVERMDKHREAIAHLAEMRAEAVREALTAGMTRAQIARALDVSPQAITQLLAR